MEKIEAHKFPLTSVPFYSCCSSPTSDGACLGWGGQRRCPFGLLVGHAVCFTLLLCHCLFLLSDDCASNSISATSAKLEVIIFGTESTIKSKRSCIDPQLSA